MTQKKKTSKKKATPSSAGERPQRGRRTPASASSAPSVFSEEGSGHETVALKTQPLSKNLAKKEKDLSSLSSSPTPRRALKSDSFSAIQSDLGIGKDLCSRCKLCKQGRTNVVFGEGNPQADLVFVGEGPGEQEDLQGRPFVGRAGQLLTKMIEAMGLRREDVFIANVVKCRPPNNRNPEPDEIEACSPFLFRQLDLIRPKVVVTLGKFSAHTLLKTEERIGLLRGRFFEYRGAKLMPTWHPAYLLRNPSAKKDTWEDLKKVAKEMGIKIPRARSAAGPGGREGNRPRPN